jgi:enoyl-[acyl-carrier-protein] reductase (NADH)
VIKSQYEEINYRCDYWVYRILFSKKTVAEGSDSSSVANFLLSDNSSWITGQILGVDGGRSSLT